METRAGTEGGALLIEAPRWNGGVVVCVAFKFQPGSVADGKATSRVVGQELELDGGRP